MTAQVLKVKTEHVFKMKNEGFVIPVLMTNIGDVGMIIKVGNHSVDIFE